MPGANWKHLLHNLDPLLLMPSGLLLPSLLPPSIDFLFKPIPGQQTRNNHVAPPYFDFAPDLGPRCFGQHRPAYAHDLGRKSLEPPSSPTKTKFSLSCRLLHLVN